MIIAYQLLPHFLTVSEAKKDENDPLKVFKGSEYWELRSGEGSSL